MMGPFWIISIHKALAGLDFGLGIQKDKGRYFNPQGPRGPRLMGVTAAKERSMISIHKALAGLDNTPGHDFRISSEFQSTRPSRASTSLAVSIEQSDSISIHKALAGLDDIFQSYHMPVGISIHKALAGLDHPSSWLSRAYGYFNPQGPRGPRPFSPVKPIASREFQSTRPSRASTVCYF